MVQGRDLPVLELLAADPPPLAGGPLLLTVHGAPLGFAAPGDPDPRATGLAVHAAEVAAHDHPPETCGWEAALLGRRPAATVVVNTIGDRPESLDRLLEALLEQSYQPLEVVVVDNRPGRWDRSVLRAHERIRVVERSLPGISAARNAGLAATTTPVVLFTDDDVVPAPDWAAWLVAALHSGPRTACATGLILPLDTSHEAQRLAEQWGGYSKGFQRRVHQHPHPSPPTALYPYEPGLYGSGGSVGFWADRLRDLGGYDEVLGTGTPARGGEDLAMHMTVVLNGLHLVYEPRAVLWHTHRTSELEWRRQLFAYGVGLSAAMTRRALSSPRDLLSVLARLPAAVRHAAHLASARNPARTRKQDTAPARRYPRRLVLMEALGMAIGPVALARSWLWRRRAISEDRAA